MKLNFSISVSTVGRQNIVQHLGLRNVFVGKGLDVVVTQSTMIFDSGKKDEDGNSIMQSAPSVFGKLRWPPNDLEEPPFIVEINTSNVNALDILYSILLETEKQEGYATPKLYQLFLELGKYARLDDIGIHRLNADVST